MSKSEFGHHAAVGRRNLPLKETSVAHACVNLVAGCRSIELMESDITALPVGTIPQIR